MRLLNRPRPPAAATGNGFLAGRTSIILLVLLTGILACGRRLPGTLTVDDLKVRPPDFPFGMPQGVPPPLVPEENPISAEKVELGRALFYDRRLSVNGRQSCADCHRQKLAFTDGKAQAIGSTGERHPRNAMSLTNVAYNVTFTWADPNVRALERQALVPMFNQEPIELGMAGHSQEILQRLAQDPALLKLFHRAFPDQEEPVTIKSVTRAVASFQRTLLSFDSPYDRMVLKGEMDALSPSAKRGMTIFFSDRLNCSKCHGGFNFSSPSGFQGGPAVKEAFHNTGLYNLKGDSRFPPQDAGLQKATGRRRDNGRFRAPTLRNIAVTAPYMHDGSIATLNEVLDHYARGGRLIEQGPYRGDGSRNPQKSRLLKGFKLSQTEREDLLEFLSALTDETFLHDPKFGAPSSSPARE